MIERDRALVKRMANVNTAMSDMVLRLLAHQDGGELNGHDLQTVGTAFIRLGADMCVRANQLLTRAVDRPAAANDSVETVTEQDRPTRGYAS